MVAKTLNYFCFQNYNFGHQDVARLLLTVCLGLGWTIQQGAAFQFPLVVDLNPDNGRSDILTRSAHNWQIASDRCCSFQLGTISASLEVVGAQEAKVTTCWWKAGYDHPARLVSDGATTSQSGLSLLLTLKGLTPGRHCLVSWHNTLENPDVRSAVMHEHQLQLELGIATNDQGPTKWISRQLVLPSHRALHDDLASSAFFEFEIQPDQAVQLKVTPGSADGNTILNGFALNAPDPKLSIRLASPTHEDLHAPERPELTWRPPASEEDLFASPNGREAGQTGESRTANSGGPQKSLRYLVYLGTDADRVARATESDPEFQGATDQPRWPTSVVDHLTDHYWRVDCQWTGQETVAGLVRRFRVRRLAFPGAEGYGRFAIGGRGGRVLHVTNLNDSGPGSLREAVEAEGPRTILFQVAGTIELKSKLLIRNPFVTIAGQSAPGDGICVSGYTLGCFGTHDVIMRYVRLRVGDISGRTMDGTGFASSDHTIFDHCSISWSIDEAVSSRGAKNITLQRCIVAEALNVANHQKYESGKGHSFAASISGDIGSFHHNLLAHCAGRNWSLAGGLDRGGRFAGRLDIRNNVVYNWAHRTNDGGVKALNLVNNLYLPGPASRVFHLLKPDPGLPDDPQQYFVQGNRMEGYHHESEDPWKKAVQLAPELVQQVRLQQPFCEPHVATHPVSELLEEVLSDVGANHAGWDDVDLRIIGDVRRRTATGKGSRTGLPGIIDSQADVGGWPTLRSGTPPSDSDQDGLPDAWEQAHGLNPSIPDQNQQLTPGGDTALEIYLAELAQRPKQPSTDPL